MNKNKTTNVILLKLCILIPEYLSIILKQVSVLCNLIAEHKNFLTECLIDNTQRI